MATSGDRLTLTVEEAAASLGISRASADEAVRRGEIPAIRIGRRILVPLAALERFWRLHCPPTSIRTTNRHGDSTHRSVVHESAPLFPPPQRRAHRRCRVVVDRATIAPERDVAGNRCAAVGSGTDPLQPNTIGGAIAQLGERLHGMQPARCPARFVDFEIFRVR